MAKRPSNSMSRWLKNQMWNTSLPWLLGCVVAGVVFYVDTSRTQDSHSKTLERLERAVSSTKTEESVERGKIRDEFMKNSKDLANGIAELNKQTAVTATILVGVQRELERIAQKLDASNPRVR